MTTQSFFPPTPEVQHLPTLFRRVQQGEIRVPAFQRGFVWNKSQALQLLESVYRGYPIGSLLFWSVKEAVLKIEHSTFAPFPEVPERYPLKFLLDGLQRLSTLYGVFHCANPYTEGMYNVIFDLDTEEFKHFEPGLVLDKTIHLSSLFSPKEFLAAQRSLSIQPDCEVLIERAIRLHSVFQEYMIPTVTIENRAVADVVSMFERINTTGTKLNAVDFMRAVTWSQDFDLNSEVVDLAATLAGTGFEISDETLVKALAIIAGKDPTPASMLELRQLSAQRLHQAMHEVRSTIDEARQFLRERLSITSYDYVPYEGQLLVLLRFLQRGGGTPEMQERLEKWFWATSFNEELRGKPDHYVVRIMNRIEDLLQGNLGSLRTRLNLSPDDLLERRFIRGKALSAAFACMFARRQARSLVTGDIIPPDSYMKEFSAKNFEGLFALKDLTAILGRDFPSNKLFANTFLFSEDDLLAMRSLSANELLIKCRNIHGKRADEILFSQFVLPDSVNEYLGNGNLLRFLRARAFAIAKEAEDLVE